MNKKDYDPIPISASRKFQQFRLGILPLLVFLIAAASVYLLWEDQVVSDTYSGTVMADTALVKSPADGRLELLAVREFSKVDAGDTLAYIFPADSALTEARLNVIRSEINAIREGRDLTLNRQQNSIDLEELNLQKVETELQLVELSYRKELAESELKRLSRLSRNNLIAEQRLDSARIRVQILNRQVTENRKLLDRLEERMAEISSSVALSNKSPVQAAVDVQNSRLKALKAELSARPVLAPLSGMLSRISHKGSGYTLSGDVLFKIEGENPDYILGYIGTPLPDSVENGMQVKLFPRRPGSAEFISEISGVGARISAAPVTLSSNAAYLRGALPVRIEWPEDLTGEVLPGEMLDFVIAGSE